MIRHLEQCIRTDKSDSRAAAELAALYLRRFERSQQSADNRMSIQEIRDTVRGAEFESSRDIAEWLVRAFGDTSLDLYRAYFSAKSSLQGQPLRGETYLILSQVGFLNGLTPDDEQGLVNQALTLRPHKPSVIYVAGLAHAGLGNMEKAIDFFSTAFARDAAIRGHVIDSMAPVFSASDFIERMKPDWDGLWLLHKHYQKNQRAEDAAIVADIYASRFKSFAETNSTQYFWIRSAEMLQSGEHNTVALSCLRKAFKVSQYDYRVRMLLAEALIGEGETNEALQHLNWCLSRRPGDKVLAARIEELSGAGREVNHGI